MGNVSSVGVSNTPITHKQSESGQSEKQKIRFAVSGMQGMRNSMEDRHLLCHSIPVSDTLGSATYLDDHSIFGVFDGHGGDFTSSFLSTNFVNYLSKRPELKKYSDLPKSGMKSRADVNGIQFLKTAFHHTFLELDQALAQLQFERSQEFAAGKIITAPLPITLSRPQSSMDEDDDDIESDDVSIEIAPKRPLQSPSSSTQGERSGSTCVVVLLTPSHFICANAGDSRAVLRRNGDVIPLSFDHKPSDVIERKRIAGAGGVVKSKRVDGDLAVSRAFGDFAFKRDKSLHVEKQKVIVVPDVLIIPRVDEVDEFIVIACDGIWDVATNKQCTDFVQSLLSDGEDNLRVVCEEALDTCLERKSRDNMTLMIVGLPGMRTEIRQGTDITSDSWGRRSNRLSKTCSIIPSALNHPSSSSIAGKCVNVEHSCCAA